MIIIIIVIAIVVAVGIYFVVKARQNNASQNYQTPTQNYYQPPTQNIQSSSPQNVQNTSRDLVNTPTILGNLRNNSIVNSPIRGEGSKDIFKTY